MINMIILVFPLLVGLSVQASTPSSSTYEAGVVEFSYGRPLTSSSEETLKLNLEKYVEIMNNASDSLDIIVFPEMTLNDMKMAVETPEPVDEISPCLDVKYPDGLIKTISCSALEKSRYVVVNAVTKAKCPDLEMIANNDPRNCSKREDGFSYYNTNLVFNRNGTLISRYRKFNLFGEKVDKPSKPMMATFDTDFGVKFGHFICFDLMFRYPALELVRELNITDFVFPTMWFSELPFLTAVQVQKAWAFSNKVNLLAAGANNPDNGSTGTGIYAGEKGSLQSVMEGSFKTQLYQAKVPKINFKNEESFVENTVVYSVQEMAALELKRDQLDKYNFTFLEDQGSTESTGKVVEHCYKELCCTFDYNFSVNRTSQKPSYRYALAVYHGSRTFDGFADGGVVTCAVLACQSNEISTCGVRNESLEYNYEWNRLKITGVFPKGEDFFYLPTSLHSSIIPFDVNKFSFKESLINTPSVTPDYSITLEILGKVKDLYAFGIYGRDFTMDAFPTDEPDAACGLQVSFLVLSIAGILTLRNISR